MFESGFFDTSPFGQGDITANSNKLLDGKNFYTGSNFSQDNPWLSTTQGNGQTYGENGYFGDTEAPQQNFQEYIGDNPNAWYSGKVYDFGNGKYAPVEFLYGYDKFGIGKNNEQTLYNMINWDQYKDIPGLISPDKFAADAFMEHWNQNNHGYTDDYDSSSGTKLLSNIANQFINQDYFKNQRGGTTLDITQTPNWANFAQADANRMGSAKAATQGMNAGSGAIISRGLQNFIQSSIGMWLGTGGWGEIGAAIGGAGEGGATAATATSSGGAAGMDDFGYLGGGMDGGGGWSDFQVPTDQYSSQGLEQYDWGGGDGFSGGGNTGYLGSTPLNSQGQWAGMGGNGGWMNAANQGMKMWNGMQGGPQGQGQSGGYNLPIGALLQGLMGMYGANKQAGAMNGMMDKAVGMADPFASQRGFYADKLRQSYQDPSAMWDSPQWQALRQKMLRDSTAKDAAAGRLTDFGSRDQRVAEAFMGEYLPKMQQGLMGPAGANANPGAGAGIMSGLIPQMAGAQAGQSNALGYLLNNLFTGQQPSTLDRIFNGAPAQNDNLFSMLMKQYMSGNSNSTPYMDYQ